MQGTQVVRKIFHILYVVTDAERAPFGTALGRAEGIPAQRVEDGGYLPQEATQRRQRLRDRRTAVASTGVEAAGVSQHRQLRGA